MVLAVFPILINTIAAMRNVSTNLIDVGTAFASREREILTKIILPSALPDMMTGLRLGIGRAIIGLVVAEFFTAITGLGALIVKYGHQYDTASMFVPIRAYAPWCYAIAGGATSRAVGRSLALFRRIATGLGKLDRASWIGQAGSGKPARVRLLAVPHAFHSTTYHRRPGFNLPPLR
jgi:hypothetical protein